jgi:hypothetical protein
VDDPELCVSILSKIHAKQFGALTAEVRDLMRAQARKRVALKITPQRVASWDHRKLAGTY